MFHTLHNVTRVLRGKPAKERPPKARWVDIFADPGGDMTANRLLNEAANREEQKEQ